MSFLVWNIKGVGNDAFVAQLRKFQFIAILEPMVYFSKLKSIRNSFKYSHHIANNDEGENFWIIFHNITLFSVIYETTQMLTISSQV